MTKALIDEEPKPKVGVTSDRLDPRLGYGVDIRPVPQHEVYLVLEEARRQNFVRPYADRYIHAKSLGGCGVVTKMGVALSETYAVNPLYYRATYCVGCHMHRPVGEDGEFFWCNEVGSIKRYEGRDWKVGT